MKLSVFHIMDPEIKAQIDPKIYPEHLGLMEIALQVEKIAQGLNRMPKTNGID
jgi:glycine reductase